jgi:hypothetical protein
MTDDLKRRLNSSVIGFVNAESERRKGSITTQEITDAYLLAHQDLIRASGVTPEQLWRRSNTRSTSAIRRILSSVRSLIRRRPLGLPQRSFGAATGEAQFPPAG